jgi:hypothetical protein
MTKDASNATLTKFYMNYREMTEEEASFYSPVLNSTMYTGKVTMMQGEVDDVWVYSRELSACEVAARYHTSEFAVDTDKVESPIDATLKLPLDDLGLNYRLNVTRAVTVSSWIYPYYTNVKQTILASKGPHMARRRVLRCRSAHLELASTCKAARRRTEVLPAMCNTCP